LSLTVAILALAVLVLVHEAGHFLAARAVGMRPRKFYLGFGPPLVKTVRGGVEYGIAALPLGGYVKIPGMHRPAPGDLARSLPVEEQERLGGELAALDAAMERGDDDGARAALARLEPELGGQRVYQELEGGLAPDAYWRQSTWKRITVIAAGPATNVLVAIVLFVAVFMLGSTNPTRTVERVLEGRPAAAAGLQPGDRILRVAGMRVAADEIARHINATGGRPFKIVVARDGRRVTLGPLRARLDQGAYRVGFQIRAVPGPGDSLPTALDRSVRAVGSVTSQTVAAIAALVTGEGTRNISSSVGIVRATSDAFKQSLQDFLGVVGLISLALALLNLLPVLPLDGGHIVMAILERVRGRAFSQVAYMRYSAVGLSLFMVLLYLGLRNDLFSSGS
jgi:regulator of sigma E protease